MSRSLKGLLRDTVVYGLAGATGQALQLLLVPVYARVFVPEQYGRVELMIATLAVVSLILGLQIDSGTAREYYEEEQDDRHRRSLVTSSLIVLAPAASAGTLSLLLLAPPLAGWLFGGSEAVTAFRLGLASVPFGLLATFAQMVLRLEDRRWSFAATGVAWTVLTLGVTIWFVVGLELGVEGVFGAKLVADIGVAALALFLVRDRLGGRFSGRVVWKVLRFGIPLIPSTVSSWGQRYVDRYLILFLLGPAWVGIYSVGLRISQVIAFFNRAFRLAWVPFAMALIDAEDRNERYRGAFRLYTAGAVSLMVTVSVLARPLVEIVATSAYGAAATVIPVLAGAWVLHGCFSLFSVGAGIARRTELTALSFIMGLAVNVGVELVLIPRIGIVGAALGSLFGFAAAAGTILWASHRIEPVGYDLVGFLKVAAIGAAATWMGALVPAVWSPALRLCVGGGVIAVGVGLIAHMALRASERQRVREALTEGIRKVIGGAAP